MIARYRKSITALVTAVLTWAGACYIPDGHVDRHEWYLLALALAGALGVYAVTNDDPTSPPPAPAAAPPAVPAVELTPAGSVQLQHSGPARGPRGRFVSASPTRFSGE